MKKKMFATVLIGTIIASMATGAYGATKLQEIKAYLNAEISLKVDGNPSKLQDSNGNPVLPITYNHTTYLPVRAVSDVLGVAVNYDSKTDTVHLGERIEGVAITSQFNSVYHTKDPDSTVYKGKDYKEVFYDDGLPDRPSGFMLFPKGQYQTLSLQIAAINEPIQQLTIKDSDNNIILKRVASIAPDDGLMTIEVDIGGVDSIYVSGDVKKGGQVFVPLTTSYYK